jgi:hypothetical protein
MGAKKLPPIISAAAVLESGKARSLFGLLGDDGLVDRAVADAAGAGLDAHDLAGLQLVADLLQVRHEAALGFDVRVADVVAGLGTLSTNIANLGHCDLLCIQMKYFVFLCCSP